MNHYVKVNKRRKISVWLLVFMLLLSTLCLPIHADGFMNNERNMSSDVNSPVEDIADGAEDIVDDLKDKTENGIVEDSDGIIEDETDKENKKGGWIALAIAALVVIGTVVVVIAVFPRKKS